MSDELRFLTELISKNSEDANRIDSLGNALRLLENSNRNLSHPNLFEVTDDSFTEDICKNLFFSLENVGIIDGGNLDYYRLQMVLESAKLESEATDKPDNKLVATIPDSEDSINRSRYSSLLLNLRDLIRNSEERLILINPFFTENIAWKLKAPLNEAAERGVEILIITRYLTYSDNENNRKFIEKIFENEKIKDRTRLFEYREEKKLGSTFHAKLILSDRRECYMGTANLTKTGLEQNLELGIIFRDGNVNRIANLIDSLMNSRLIRRINYHNGEFGR